MTVLTINEIFEGMSVLDPSEDVGTEGRVEWLEISDLLVDMSYQRPIFRDGLRNIRRIVEGFRWEKFEAIIVAPSEDHPGKYFVIDGQHRAIAARLHPDVERIPALVHELTSKEQARAFRDVNKNRTRMTALHIYHAGLVAGDPASTGIKAVTRSAGVEVAKHNISKANMDPHQCVCVNAISKCLQRHGFNPVSKALQVLRITGQEVDMCLISAFCVQVLSAMFHGRGHITVEHGVELMSEVDIEGEIRERARDVVSNPGQLVPTAAAFLAQRIDARLKRLEAA